MHYFRVIFHREWLFAYRKMTEILNPWIFFLIIVTLFPLALNPHPALLKLLAPGIIWISILLSTLLALEKLFRREVEDGVIEQWLLAPVSFLMLVQSKLIANWCSHYVPLLFFMPVLGLWLDLSMHTLFVLFLSILIATPILFLVGAIFSALTVRLSNNGVLLSILVLPFYIPVLIFAASAVANAEAGLPASGQLAFLGALLALVLPLAPFAVAIALRLEAS
jgi:heme exporter protein B